MIFNEEDQEVRDLGYQKHAFNMLISNRLGYHREVPDTRDAKYVLSFGENMIQLHVFKDLALHQILPDLVCNIFGVTFPSDTLSASCVTEGRFSTILAGALGVRNFILWSLLFFFLHIACEDLAFYQLGRYVVDMWKVWEDCGT